MNNDYMEYAQYEEFNNLEILKDLNINHVTSIKKEKSIKCNNKYLKIEHIPINNIPEIIKSEDINTYYNRLRLQNSYFSIKYFDTWRKNNNLEKIDITSLCLINKKNNFKKIDCQKFENINHKSIIFNCCKLLNLHEEKVHFYQVDHHQSFTVELPFTEESIICIDNSQDSFFEKKIYLLHEIGHAYFNNLKYENKLVTSIEIDEIAAHLVELFLVKNFFTNPEIEDYKKIVFNRYLKVIQLTIFQLELFVNIHDYGSLEDKNKLFHKITGFNYSWQLETQLFTYPLYSSSYIVPLKNIWDKLLKNEEITFDVLNAHILDLIVSLQR